MVGLEVIGPTGLRITDAALVDTGADVSAFPLSWMRRLKILKKHCRRETIETAAGHGIQWRYEEGVDAVILGRKLTLQATFADTPVALLGREDFLMYFRVSFNQRAFRFTVRAY